jgi:hypothetical protein
MHGLAENLRGGNIKWETTKPHRKNSSREGNID